MAFSRASAMQSFVTKEVYWVVLAREGRRHRLVFRMLDFGLKATEVKEAFEKAIWKIKISVIIKQTDNKNLTKIINNCFLFVTWQGGVEFWSLIN